MRFPYGMPGCPASLFAIKELHLLSRDLIRNSRMPIHLKGHFDQELLRLERLEVRHMKIVRRCKGAPNIYCRQLNISFPEYSLQNVGT